MLALLWIFTLQEKSLTMKRSINDSNRDKEPKKKENQESFEEFLNDSDQFEMTKLNLLLSLKL